MGQDTTITVIMSVKNNEDTITLAMDSVFAQTYQNFKMIVVDDNSTDKTPDILSAYKAQHTNLTVITNDQSLGLAKNLNTMLEMSDTPYIARMDGDDICALTRFEKQIHFLDNNPDIDILGTCADIIDETGRIKDTMQWPTDDAAIKKAIWCNPMIHPSIMMRREKILSIGGYPQYPRRQDYALWFKAMRAGLKFHNLPESLMQYRIVTQHYKKTKFNDALRQTKIGWCGYASVGGWNPVHYGIMAWPIARSVLPVKTQQYLQKTLGRFDPRRKIN